MQMVEQYVNHIDPKNVSCVFEPLGIWTDMHGDPLGDQNLNKGWKDHLWRPSESAEIWRGSRV